MCFADISLWRHLLWPALSVPQNTAEHTLLIDLPTNFDWTPLKASNLGIQAAEGVSWGGGGLRAGGPLGRDEAAALILPRPWLSQWCAAPRGRHRASREGSVILVAWNRASRLWGRALISTNRFLIRASRALHLRTHVYTQTHTHTHTLHICAKCL